MKTFFRPSSTRAQFMSVGDIGQFIQNRTHHLWLMIGGLLLLRTSVVAAVTVVGRRLTRLQDPSNDKFWEDCSVKQIVCGDGKAYKDYSDGDGRKVKEDESGRKGDNKHKFVPKGKNGAGAPKYFFHPRFNMTELAKFLADGDGVAYKQFNRYALHMNLEAIKTVHALATTIEATTSKINAADFQQAVVAATTSANAAKSKIVQATTQIQTAKTALQSANAELQSAASGLKDHLEGARTEIQSAKTDLQSAVTSLNSGDVKTNLKTLRDTLPQVTEKVSQIDGKIQALNEASEAATTAAKELKDSGVFELVHEAVQTAVTNNDGKMDERMKSMEWKLMCVLCMNGIVLLVAVVSVLMGCCKPKEHNRSKRNGQRYARERGHRNRQHQVYDVEAPARKKSRRARKPRR